MFNSKLKLRVIDLELDSARKADYIKALENNLIGWADRVRALEGEVYLLNCPYAFSIGDKVCATDSTIHGKVTERYTRDASQKLYVVWDGIVYHTFYEAGIKLVPVQKAPAKPVAKKPAPKKTPKKK